MTDNCNLHQSPHPLSHFLFILSSFSLPTPSRIHTPLCTRIRTHTRIHIPLNFTLQYLHSGYCLPLCCSCCSCSLSQMMPLLFTVSPFSSSPSQLPSSVPDLFSKRISPQIAFPPFPSTPLCQLSPTAS